MSWFVICFCFWPLGCCALRSSHKVRAATRRGDLDNARLHSELAKRLNKVGVLLGVIGILFWVLQLNCAVDFLGACSHSGRFKLRGATVRQG